MPSGKALDSATAAKSRSRYHRWLGPPPRDLLADKGFNGKAFAAAQAARGTAVLVPPGKKQRAAMPSSMLKAIAEWRNRIETTFSEITDRMELARHGAHTFWGP